MNSNFINNILKTLTKYPSYRLYDTDWNNNLNIFLDRDIGNFSHVESNHDISNEIFIKTCPICKSGINQYLNDDKGHHQATCSSNAATRKYMHDNCIL
jgi:hypothetical protein